MTPAEIHEFAHRLMREVWEPFDDSRLAEFYHRDVLGHHRSQTLTYSDILNRLAWDRRTRRNPQYEIKELIAEGDRFAIRFSFTTLESPTPENSEFDVVYFYRLRDRKIAEFWLLASADFDYREPA